MRLARLLISVLIVLMQASACLAQQIITLEEAKNAVRTFEGDQGLQFSLAEYEQLQCLDEEECLESPEWIRTHSRMYKLEAGERPDESFWRVDAVTGEVDYVRYANVGPATTTRFPPGPLTQSECRQIAENFARAKYAEFDTMGFQLMTEQWDGCLWCFEWEQVVAYGAITPNSAEVKVNSEDGEIGAYSSFRMPTPVPQEPQISAQQAIDIAQTDAGIVTLQYAEPPTLGVNPDNTYWTLDVRGLDSDQDYVCYSMGVDAVSGAVISKYALAIDPPRPESLVPIRDLAAKVPGAKVYWLGKEAKLFIGRNRYTLVPGKDTIEWTGGTIKLSQKMKVVNGRLMVPSGLLDVLRSASAPKKAPPTPAKPK